MTQAALPLPAKLLICPWGVSYTNAGRKIVVNEETVAALPGQQQRMGAEEIALDFEHNSYLADADEEKKKDPILVAAYGAPSCETGVGIVMEIPDDKWTPEGEQYYGGKHYRDVSPVLRFSADGETVIGVASVALTRKGAIPGLHAFSQQIQDTNTKIMTEEEANTLKAETAASKKALFDLVAQLGITVPEAASSEEILQAVAKWQEEAKSAEEEKAEGEKTEEEKKKEEEAKKAEGAFSAEFKALSNRLDKIQKANDESAKKAMIQQAVQAGKKLPLSASKLLACSSTFLGDLLGALKPGEVPFSASSVTPGEDGKKKPLTAEQKAACKRMGITEEAFSANL